ncbi:MAG: hypothetical protein K2Q18_17525 [Bdellovibrionales bacterium]|nr:hypothetical protein [Bdellovibrionales bacterium]
MKTQKISFLFLMTIFAFGPVNLKATEMKLKSFETDGCTMFADGTNTSPTLWKHCCTEHDLRYWFGGSTPDLDATDLRLKACVLKVAGENWAMLIYNGVRAGHYSPIKNKFQWNWGWSVKREKTPLTEAEIDYVKIELRKLKVAGINIDDFINVNFP